MLLVESILEITGPLSLFAWVRRIQSLRETPYRVRKSAHTPPKVNYGVKFRTHFEIFLLPWRDKRIKAAETIESSVQLSQDFKDIVSKHREIYANSEQIRECIRLTGCTIK